MSSRMGSPILALPGRHFLIVIFISGCIAVSHECMEPGLSVEECLKEGDGTQMLRRKDSSKCRLCAGKNKLVQFSKYEKIRRSTAGSSHLLKFNDEDRNRSPNPKIVYPRSYLASSPNELERYLNRSWHTLSERPSQR